MKTFRDYILENRNQFEGVKLRLAEMPLRIPEMPKDKVVKDINSFWELAKDENPTVVGKIGSEEVVRVGNSSVRYFFILKNDKPIFFIGLDKRMDLSGWQITYAAKTNSETSYKKFLKFILRNQTLGVVCGNEQTPSAERVWKKILKDPKCQWDALDDNTGKHVEVKDVDQAWDTDIVFRILKY